MHPVLKQISDIGIVPVIAIDDAEKAVRSMRANFPFHRLVVRCHQTVTATCHETVTSCHRTVK